MKRRQFLSAAAASGAVRAQSGERPNILWVTCEDMSPHLGCYGDPHAKSPRIDALSADSLRYRNAWSNAPVCAPARTTIISGMYPPSTGSEHMRSNTRLPAGMKMFPQFLRDAGYYCTNNAKEDYNLEKPNSVWDESSNKAHWRKRQPGQPFFSVFNFTITHESQIRMRPHELRHDPARVRIPTYHPDTPEVRRDWAQSYDNIETMDGQVGGVLDQLANDGLDGSTIVFFYSDHGSGMPRSKRWPFDSGLHVPMIVHIPERFRHLRPPGYGAGRETDRLVSFVDLAPTVLSLAGIRPPSYHQGHAFLGPHATAEQPYIYGFRGRMDERYDMVRSVRDKRYVYLRHYMPDRAYGQHVAYMFETPTTARWHQLHEQGKLTPQQDAFWREKPAEELFDLQTDRDEVHNLANSPEHKQVAARMRKAQEELCRRIRDTGFLPEDEIHKRPIGSTPYEYGHDPNKYPLDRIMRMAGLASSRRAGDLGEVIKGFDDPDSAVRYWSALGARMRGAEGVNRARAALTRALSDAAPSVRIVAAEALAYFGDRADLEAALPVLVEHADQSKHGPYLAMLALNALDYLDAKAKPVEAKIAALPEQSGSVDQRIRANPGNLIRKTLADLRPR
jgi:uncharacterized sulfatase